MLSDLSDALVERAVTALIQTKTDAFPNTNWIAEIRQAALAAPRSALTPEQDARRRRLLEEARQSASGGRTA